MIYLREFSFKINLTIIHILILSYLKMCVNFSLTTSQYIEHSTQTSCVESIKLKLIAWMTIVDVNPVLNNIKSTISANHFLCLLSKLMNTVSFEIYEQANAGTWFKLRIVLSWNILYCEMTHETILIPFGASTAHTTNIFSFALFNPFSSIQSLSLFRSCVAVRSSGCLSDSFIFSSPNDNHD